MIVPEQDLSIDDALGRIGHAWRIGPLVEPLVAALMFSPLGGDAHKHHLYRRRTGMNSWCLDVADGREFHFRGASEKQHYDCIEVYDCYRRHVNAARPVVVLRTREDCRKWAATLVFNPFVAKANGLSIRPEAA